MANVGGPNNNQPQPDLQAFKNAADRARDNTQIKVDSNTGNVGTRSLFGRAWRAVTPASADSRESNMRDIERFKTALLNQNNKQSDVRLALDRFLPGHRDGNVPLTAGAVRRSIEYLNIENTTLESVVDLEEFKTITEKQYAAENRDFYIAARNMLGDGGDRIAVKEFETVVELYVAVDAEKEINIPGPLRERITQFKEHTHSPSYSAFYSAAQSEAARHLLQAAQREVAGMLCGGALKEFKQNLSRELDQR